MADLAGKVGGGEAAVPSPPDNTQEIKPDAVTSLLQSEAKNETPAVQVETKEVPQKAPQPETVKQEETPVAELAQKDEPPKLEAVKQESEAVKLEETPVAELAQKDEPPKLEAVKQEPEAVKQDETPVAELAQKEEPPKLEAVKQEPESVKQEETPITEVVQKTESPKLETLKQEPEAVKQDETPIAEVAQKDEPPKSEVVKQEETPQPVVPKNEELTLPEAKPQEAGDASAQNSQDNTKPKQLDWQLRELELLKKISELEKGKSGRSEDSFKLEIKVREEEIDLLKARVKNLETELQAVLSKPSGKNHEMIENIKQQHEELLSKARGMIFDKTKMVKNQELQIEALTTQVQSLKDINLITKDLLEIRNSEVKAMEERFQAMEARFKAEKDRYGLVLQRAQTSTNINDDLRKEYETQLGIFKELREKYELRVQALVAENARLKEEAQKGGPSG